jgi:hypothetical protein
MVKHSNYGQTPVSLSFNGNKEATIATNDQNYRIPTTWIQSLPQSTGIPCTIREVQEVRSAHAQIGLDSNIFQWTTSPPVGGGGDVNNGYAQLNVPGLYHFLIMRKSDAAIWLLDITVSYISDPWIKVDGIAHLDPPHLTDFNGTVVAENLVEMELSSVFENPDYTKKLYKDETQISTGNLHLQIRESGNPGIMHFLLKVELVLRLKSHISQWSSPALLPSPPSNQQ